MLCVAVLVLLPAEEGHALVYDGVTAFQDNDDDDLKASPSVYDMRVIIRNSLKLGIVLPYQSQ